MILILKFLHLFSLLLGGAATGGNTVLGALVTRSGAPPPPMVEQAMGILTKAGFLAIVVLWLTGLPLAYMVYGSMDLGGVFSAKLLFATVVLAASLAMNVHALNARRNGRPPTARVMRGLGTIASLSVVIVIALTANIFAAAG
ncbi:MAG: hypothetical protein ACE5FS_14180 [Paracoccaceae bacterium]